MYRISELLRTGQQIFHTADLATIWNISNKNTLYTTIKRYVKNRVLFTIHKGFYSLVPPQQIDPYILGIGFLHRYAYVSTETILARYGIISQTVYPITIVSDVSKRFTINNQLFLVRKMKTKLLYDSAGLEIVNGVLTATQKRAISDMLYFDPSYHFDKKI